MEFKFDPIEEIVEEIRQGHIVIMQDPADRENEGDYICAAEFATPENINRMASEARGLICMPMAGEIADALYLAPMVRHNTDSNQTAFLTSIDFKDAGTGISAAARSMTPMEAVRAGANPADFKRPGHMFPLHGRDIQRPLWIWPEWRDSNRQVFAVKSWMQAVRCLIRKAFLNWQKKKV